MGTRLSECSGTEFLLPYTKCDSVGESFVIWTKRRADDGRTDSRVASGWFSCESTGTRLYERSDTGFLPLCTSYWNAHKRLLILFSTMLPS